MVLSKAYLLGLIRDGYAQRKGICVDSNGKGYVIVDRFDIHRTDHYLATIANVDTAQQELEL